MLDARTSLAKLQTMYREKEGKKALSALIIGDKGVGKTHLLSTCRKPILHISFDPDGEQLPIIAGMNARGECLSVTHYQANDAAAFTQFEKDWEVWRKEKLFDQFATVCLDSLTTLGDTCIEWVLSSARGVITEKGKPHGERMELQDWGTFADKMRYWVKTILALPCDAIILGHVRHDKDDLTGRIIQEVYLPGKTAQAASIWVSELWCLELKTSYDPKGAVQTVRRLVTGGVGDIKASTRIGGPEDNGQPGKLSQFEPADIKAILAKVGKPTNDLPLLPVEKG